MLTTGDVVDFSEKPTGCNEMLALTDRSDISKCSENEVVTGNPDNRCFRSLDPASNTTDGTISSLGNAFGSNSSLSVISDDSLPSSPASPSFSEINPNDLFWIALPELDESDDDGEMVVEVTSSEMGNVEEIVVEIISCDADGDDDDVVILKEIRRFGSKRELLS